MDTEELETMLDYILSQELNDIVELEELLRVYAQAKEAVDAYQKILDETKYHVNRALLRLGKDVFVGEFGKAERTAPTQYPSYDTKALEALRSSSDEVARLLDPHRKIVQRATSLRITVKKGDKRA